jgi:hypothetical protein
MTDYLRLYTNKYNTFTKADARKRALTAQSVFNFIEKYDLLSTQKMLIDYGCGDGSLLDMLIDSMSKSSNNQTPLIVAIDIDPSSRQYVKDKHSDQENLKVYSSYDELTDLNYMRYNCLGICSHVLEHVENPREFLKSLIKISNRWVFVVPLDDTVFLTRRLQALYKVGHINHYNKNTIISLFKTLGLLPNIVEIKLPSLRYHIYMHGLVLGATLYTIKSVVNFPLRALGLPAVFIQDAYFYLKSE